MYNYHHNLLPSSFENFFKTVASIHSYNTRLASKSTYYLNNIKQTMVNSTFALRLQKFGITLMKALNTCPLNPLKTKSCQTSYSLTVRESSFFLIFYLFFYLFIYLFIFFILFFFHFFSFYLYSNSLFVLALVPTYLLCLNII